MKKVTGQKFSHGQVVEVDDSEFINCEFSGCAFTYSGGDFRFDDHCRYSHISFMLQGAALRTAQFMQAFGLHGKRLIVGDDAKRPM